MIAGFFDEYRFLSNFWWYVDTYGNRTTVEHHYQARKARNPRDAEFVLGCATPGKAKTAGRNIEIVSNWEDIKIDVMRDLVREKFTNHELRSKLLATGNQELIELNTWGDSFWGQCPLGIGDNWLGKILMQIRDEIRNTGN